MPGIRRSKKTLSPDQIRKLKGGIRRLRRSRASRSIVNVSARTS